MFKIQIMKFIKYVLVLSLLVSISKATKKKENCEVCIKLIDKFQMGLVKTAKSNFGGGNSHWEEQKLGRYEFSETRFLEVIEGVCSEGDRQCQSMLEELEETFEGWWRKYYALEVESDLREFMCVRRLKACCARGTYGSECRPCRGGRQTPCTGNGVCQGDGTRTGTGECVCDVAYEGEACERCAAGYYQTSVSTANKVHCAGCDVSCRGACEGGGPAGCKACREGWVWIGTGTGCSDVNECEDETMCRRNELCVNKEGSYKCVPCDKSCSSCTGLSNLQCISCSSNFYSSPQNACLPCHHSCLGGCRDQMASSCLGCRKGWSMTQEGCLDVDECAGAGQCQEDEYCINTEGAFKCSTCHSSCDGCHDSGNEKCRLCKQGYELLQGSCMDMNECLGGVCAGANRRCINVPGSFVCECVAGFSMHESGVCVPSLPVTGGKMSKQTDLPARDYNKDKVLYKQKNPVSLIKKKRKKSLPKHQSLELLYYLLTLILFAVVACLSASFVSVQAIFTGFFTVYLYHHASHLDEVFKNSP